MIHLQCIGIMHSSEIAPPLEFRRWRGEADICKGKNKRRFVHVSRAIANTVFPKYIVSVMSNFLGRENVPAEIPTQEMALWPLKTANRTIFA